MSEFEEQLSISVFRALAPAKAPGKVSNPRCDAKGCQRTTREGKPYCSSHVEESVYVKSILQELALRDQEAARLTEGLDINTRGHLIRESLLMLEQGSYTAAKLSRLMDISHIAAETLIRVMAKKGLAQMGKTDRGALTIKRNPK
jgi:predicted HTH transcriptional regulator